MTTYELTKLLMSNSDISLPPGYELEVNLPEGYELVENPASSKAMFAQGRQLGDIASLSQSRNVSSASPARSSPAGNDQPHLPTNLVRIPPAQPDRTNAMPSGQQQEKIYLPPGYQLENTAALNQSQPPSTHPQPRRVSSSSPTHPPAGGDQPHLPTNLVRVLPAQSKSDVLAPQVAPSSDNVFVGLPTPEAVASAPHVPSGTSLDQIQKRQSELRAAQAEENFKQWVPPAGWEFYTPEQKQKAINWNRKMAERYRYFYPHGQFGPYWSNEPPPEDKPPAPPTPPPRTDPSRTAQEQATRDRLAKMRAGYREPTEPQPYMDPLTGFPTAEVNAVKAKYDQAAGRYVQWTPREQEILNKLRRIDQSSTAGLDTANRYLVQPFDKMAEKGRQAGEAIGEALYGEAGPRVSGVAKGVFGTVGGMAADPRMWPFFLAGPEAGAGGRFLSRAVNSTLQRAATVGFAAQMGVGTIQQAAQVHDIWNRPDIPLDQKYEAITSLVLNAMMAAHGTRSAVRGETLARPQPLDPRLAAELDAMGPEGKQQVFRRLQAKLQSQTRHDSPTRSVPKMGHNMTADSPAVRKVQAESHPTPGQVPEVKVKQEPPQVKAELARPPAPVRAEEAARIGQPDQQSGRTILQPSNDVIQNERLANQAAPDLTTRLSRIAASVRGAKLDRLRPQKGLERLQEKVASGKPPRTIGDNLAAQIVADTVEAKDQLISRLQQEFPVISVDDKFTQPREKAGYPSANVQVQMANGGTAEVQIVTPEVQAITDQTHALYTAGRRFAEGSADRAWYWNHASEMHREALNKFFARDAEPSATTALTSGQQVILNTGEPGTIEGFFPNLNRVVVNTRNGWKTVRPEAIRPQTPLQRLTGRLPSETVQKFVDAFVPLTPEETLNVAAKVSSFVEKGDGKLPDLLWTNHPVVHLIWLWEPTSGQPFTGVFLHPTDVVKFVKKFEAAARDLRNAGRHKDASAVEQVIEHLRSVNNKDGAVALGLRTGDAHHDQITAREERAHVIQNRIGGGDNDAHANLAKLWMEPEFRKATANLARQGYRNNPPSVTLEAATKLLLGEGRLMGLSEAEEVSAIRKYLLSITEKYGPHAADDLMLVAEPRYHRIFDEVNR